MQKGCLTAPKCPGILVSQGAVVLHFRPQYQSPSNSAKRRTQCAVFASYKSHREREGEAVELTGFPGSQTSCSTNCSVGNWNNEDVNFILAPITVLMMAAYNVNLYLRFKKNPMGTVMGVNHRGRRAWVKSIMQDNDKKNILAVQTLRNSIMGSTLMATTCILLSVGVATFLASTYNVKTALHASLLGLETTGNLIVTYIALLVGFLFSFLCFVQSLRYTNHVNFIINVPAQGQFTPDYIADVLERAANFYTIGTRGLYQSIPLLMWLFGPIAFFLSALFLIPVWYWLDTAQECKSMGDSSTPQDVETEFLSRSHSRAPLHPQFCSTL